jgi:hypothetical protein
MAQNVPIMHKKIVFILSLIGVIALSRLLPHPPNFTPVAAMALFGGAVFSSKKMAFLVPLGAMFLSDMVIGWMSGAGVFGFHSTMPTVYIALCLTVCLGFLLKDRRSVVRVSGVSFSASVLFFVMTNFAVWAEGVYYLKNWSGLVTCFVAAIPFFHYTLLGDLCYVTVMFGALVLAEKWVFPKITAV